jgi:hypothetical protein
MCVVSHKISKIRRYHLNIIAYVKYCVLQMSLALAIVILPFSFYCNSALYCLSDHCHRYQDRNNKVNVFHIIL